MCEHEQIRVPPPPTPEEEAAFEESIQAQKAAEEKTRAAWDALDKAKAATRQKMKDEAAMSNDEFVARCNALDVSIHESMGALARNNLYADYAALASEVKDDVEALKIKKRQLADKGQEVQAKMDLDQLDRVTVNGTTIHEIRDLSVKTLDRAKLLEWLKAHGWESALTANGKTLKSIFKDLLSGDAGWEPDKSRLPEGLRDLVDVSEFVRLSTKGG